ncbi:MAG: glycosyltransferase family 39 protein [Solirubrobacteraceae bacterium]
MLHRLRSVPGPLLLLLAISLASLGARTAWLGAPCRSPCRSAGAHLLIFDETYYVNAARVIAGVSPPAGQHYARTPLGEDPNSEHPQLAKLVIAGSIELLGDGPLAWRGPSVLLGSLALLGVFALARAAGAGRWPAAAGAVLMASDNLVLVHGRIATLDIYVLTAMIWAVVLYLRGRPLSGGAVLGVGACCKLVAPYALLTLVMLEALRIWGRPPAELAASWRPAVRRLASFLLSGAAVLLAGLAILDAVAPPYDPGARRPVAGGPFAHLSHMVSYAATQRSPHGPHGIASYPFDWLVDYKPIVYLNINPAIPSPGFGHTYPQTDFLGMISPPIMLLATPALLLAGSGWWRRRRRVRPEPQDPAGPPDWQLGELAIVGLAWFLGTFLPFLAVALLWQRTSYLYYMVIVMPGIYLSVVALIVGLRRYRRWLVAWLIALLAAAVLMYPFVPIT